MPLEAATNLLEPIKLTVLKISPSEYEAIRKLIYDRAGINLGANKQHLIQARLNNHLERAGLEDFEAYYNSVISDSTGEQLAELIDAISTNTTYFFREAEHFNFLANNLSCRMAQMHLKRQEYCFRIWSAGCSSGEEPYSIAMVVHQAISNSPKIQAKILATDIWRQAVSRGQSGRYEQRSVQTVPERYRQRYFTKVSCQDPPRLRVTETIRSMVKFAQLNLMAKTFPFRHGFDYIFCRNVMIYFDRRTQEQLLGRFYRYLKPGGFVIVGHCESLNSIRHKFKYIQPTIYQKPDD